MSVQVHIEDPTNKRRAAVDDDGDSLGLVVATRQLKTLDNQVKFFSNRNGWPSDLAQFLVEEGVDQIIVSVDAFDDATYSAIRRKGRLADVRQEVGRLIEAKRALRRAEHALSFNTVVFKNSVAQVAGAIKFA